MRLLVMFDLPTTTSAERKCYREFRKFLLSEGFLMHQFSIYSKILLNDTAKTTCIHRIRQNKPAAGNVTILTITEKQFARMIYICGSPDSSVANTDKRIVILGD